MSEWQTRRISDLIDGLTAGVSVRSVDGAGFGPSVLKTSAVDQGRFVSNEVKTILPVDRARARCNPVAGSLIISRMNTPAMVGDVGYVDKTYPNLFLPDRLWLARSKRGASTDMRWLTYFFASEPGAALLHGLASGTSMSMQSIPKDRVLALEIDAPGADEQRAIGDALEDVERLIATLERRVVKKRAVKEGVMQELLTGRTRLPGFATIWEPAKLGAMATMGSGGTPSSSNTKYYGGGVPWVSISDMTRGGKYIGRTEKTLTTQGLAASSAKLYEPNVVLYAMYASLGECSLAVGRVSSSQAILGIKPGPGLDPEFLYYSLQYLKPRVKSLGQQGTQSNLNAGMVRGFDLTLPRVDEQTAIATVLADIDLELDALDQQLAQARAIKQGMMQQLLTGRVRLFAEVAA